MKHTHLMGFKWYFFYSIFEQHMHICLKVRYVLENCKEDMELFNAWIEKDIIHGLSV